MELGFLVALVVGTAVFAGVRLVAEHRAANWRDTARRVGLTDVHEKKFLGILHDLRGESGDFTVVLQHYSRGKNDNGTRL
jgi:hypothetical protein